MNIQRSVIVFFRSLMVVAPYFLFNPIVEVSWKQPHFHEKLSDCITIMSVMIVTTILFTKLFKFIFNDTRSFSTSRLFMMIIASNLLTVPLLWQPSSYFLLLNAGAWMMLSSLFSFIMILPKIEPYSYFFQSVNQHFFGIKRIGVALTTCLLLYFFWNGYFCTIKLTVIQWNLILFVNALHQALLLKTVAQKRKELDVSDQKSSAIFG